MSELLERLDEAKNGGYVWKEIEDGIRALEAELAETKHLLKDANVALDSLSRPIDPEITELTHPGSVYSLAYQFRKERDALKVRVAELEAEREDHLTVLAQYAGAMERCAKLHAKREGGGQAGAGKLSDGSSAAANPADHYPLQREYDNMEQWLVACDAYRNRKRKPGAKV